MIAELLTILELNAGPRCVLVVEDGVTALEMVTLFLETLGHYVVGILGVDAIDGDQLTGPTADGTKAVVDLKTIQAAFLDYYFLGGRFNGKHMVTVLALHGITRVCGMSSDRAANQSMLAAGAPMAVRKRDLLDEMTHWAKGA